MRVIVLDRLHGDVFPPFTPTKTADILVVVVDVMFSFGYHLSFSSLNSYAVVGTSTLLSALVPSLQAS